MNTGLFAIGVRKRLRHRKVDIMKENQHTVPEFYLKYFAINGSGLIWRFDVDRNEIDPRKRSIRKETAKKFFYDLDNYDMTLDDLEWFGEFFEFSKDSMKKIYNSKQLLEDFLERVETKMGKRHEDLAKHLNGEIDCDTQTFRCQYAIFLVLQSLRTESMRNFFSMMNATEKRSGLPSEIMSDKERYLGLLQHMPTIFRKAKNLVENYRWEIIIMDSGLTFLTSDNPAAEALHQPELIHFPITPKYCWRLAKLGSIYEDRGMRRPTRMAYLLPDR